MNMKILLSLALIFGGLVAGYLIVNSKAESSLWMTLTVRLVLLVGGSIALGILSYSYTTGELLPVSSIGKLMALGLAIVGAFGISLGLTFKEYHRNE